MKKIAHWTIVVLLMSPGFMKTIVENKGFHFQRLGWLAKSEKVQNQYQFFFFFFPTGSAVSIY